MKKNYVPAFNFDILTPYYDFFVELIGYGKSQRAKVVDLLDLKNDDRLLDVGSGTGTLLVLAKQKYPKVDMTGIDIDPNVLRIARDKTEKAGLKIHYVETSSAKLPFSDSTFDVVVSTLVFHHLPADVKRQTVKEIFRILKKDGRFLLADFGKKDGFVLSGLDFITRFLHLPESKTLQDNLEGKLPSYMKEVGFNVKEIRKRNLGIQYLLGQK